MTPTKYAVEPYLSTLRAEAGEALVRALVYSDDVGYDALITWDAGAVSAHVTEISRGPEQGYVPLTQRDPAADEACRRIVDCSDDFAELIEAYLREHYADQAYDHEHCAGCSTCLGVPSYSGF